MKEGLPGDTLRVSTEERARHLVRDADDQDRDLLDAYDARRARSGHVDDGLDA
jgi:hypothetical protein